MLLQRSATRNFSDHVPCCQDVSQQPSDLRNTTRDPLRAKAQQPLSLHTQPLPVAGMVVGSGYATAKGQLLRAMLFPKPSAYDFERKLYYFLLNLIGQHNMVVNVYRWDLLL